MYHLTFVRLGRNPILKPFVPQAEGENDTPRVCFAPTLKQCIMGITGMYDLRSSIRTLGGPKNIDDLLIYKVNPIGLIDAIDVADSYRTAEKWSLSPIRAIFDGYVDLLKTYEFNIVVRKNG